MGWYLALMHVVCFLTRHPWNYGTRCTRTVVKYECSRCGQTKFVETPL